MSTTARDKAWKAYYRSELFGSTEVATESHRAHDAGFDAGRASVLSALTVERIARALWGEATEDGDDQEWTWDYLVERANRGDGDYSEIREGWFRAARAVLALIEQETNEVSGL